MCALFSPLAVPRVVLICALCLVSHFTPLSILVCLLNAQVTLLIKHSAGISNLHFKPLFTVGNFTSVWLFN